jgi:AcrR family transcriptional regulator
LATGRSVLISDGAPGVRIDAMAARLGATKGSFYHHFGSARGFKLALLEDMEIRHTRRQVEAVETDGLPPRARLERLVDLVLPPGSDGDEAARLEVALRAWAHQDPDVHAYQERVDAARCRYLGRLWAEIDPSADPDDAGRLVYSVLVGGRHLVPSLDDAAIRRTYRLLLDLVPGGDAP